MPLVKLVEDYSLNPRQEGILLHLPKQDPFRDIANDCCCGGAIIEPDLIADLAP